MPPPLTTLVRQKVLDMMAAHGVTHERLAKWLDTDRSNVSRLLKEGPRLTLDAVERLAEFFQLTPAELVAEPGAQVLPLAPLEVQLIARFRKMTPLERQSLLTVLDWQSHQPRSAKLRRAHLAAADAILLALYHALDHAPDAQAAFIGALREHPAALMKRATPP